RDHRRGEADRSERDEGARKAPDLPADQARDQHVRARRGLPDGKGLDEVRGREPALHVDHEALHLRHHRRQPADRDEGKQREVEAELDQAHSQPRRAANTATPSPIGTTISSETRATATSRKHAAISASAVGFFASGRPSLTAVPMKSPAPAAPTPVTIAFSVALEDQSL